MLKIVTIIGARPQIIKASAISRAVKDYFATQITEIIVHTGQHYDPAMSQVFFGELSIPQPHYNLNVGSGAHGVQTAKMIEGIEKILIDEKPDWIVLYGDTNSTLAGAIAAAKIHVPIAHIEAGLRSYNKAMPEEINRIMCDHASTLLFSPTSTGYDNLMREGFSADTTQKASANAPHVYHCGDVMFDNLLHFSTIANQKTTLLHDLKLTPNNYILATVHRDNNTDVPERLHAILRSMNTISTQHNLAVVLPLHPRTRKILAQPQHEDIMAELAANAHFHIIEPLSYLQMIVMQHNARLIMTDSGGVQKEAFFFAKPCIILRHETEWTELITCGMATLCDADGDKIITAFNVFNTKKVAELPNLYGDGAAAQFILGKLLTEHTAL
ncbi:MAG: UDP-N-acetylglucosamine 2-epimerase (non-hydrolyzing) [Bacteroidia bacterium]